MYKIPIAHRRFFSRLLPPLAFVALLMNWLFVGLRFSTNLANDIFALAVTCLLLRWCVNGLRRLWRVGKEVSRLRWEGMGFLVLVLLYLSFVVLIQGMRVAMCLAAHDPNYGYHLVRSQPTPQGTIYVYRHSISALDDYSVVVRLEKPILPGLIRSRTLFSHSPAGDVVIEAEDSGRCLRITPPGKSSAYGKTVTL